MGRKPTLEEAALNATINDCADAYPHLCSSEDGMEVMVTFVKFVLQQYKANYKALGTPADKEGQRGGNTLNGQQKEDLKTFNAENKKIAESYVKLIHSWLPEAGQPVADAKVIATMRTKDGITLDSLREMYRYLYARGKGKEYQNRVTSLKDLRDKYAKLVLEAQNNGNQAKPQGKVNPNDLQKELDKRF